MSQTKNILLYSHCAHKQGSNLVVVLVCPESSANNNEVGLPWFRKAPRRVPCRAPRRVPRQAPCKVPRPV